jgi:hypothetical protein
MRMFVCVRARPTPTAVRRALSHVQATERWLFGASRPTPQYLEKAIDMIHETRALLALARDDRRTGPSRLESIRMEMACHAMMLDWLSRHADGTVGSLEEIRESWNREIGAQPESYLAAHSSQGRLGELICHTLRLEGDSEME